MSEQAVAEEIEVTDTIEVTEVATDTPKPILEVTPEEREESKNCPTFMTTPPGSPPRENPEVQNNSEGSTEVDAEQAVKKTHKYPETSNSLVIKYFQFSDKQRNPTLNLPLSMDYKCKIKTHVNTYLVFFQTHKEASQLRKIKINHSKLTFQNIKPKEQAKHKENKFIH